MNESIHERIKYLRKNELKMTQIEFGKQLGSAGSTVVGWEKGDRTPPDATIKLICKEFNVNYSWLVNGTGEIFLETDDALLEALAEEYGLSEIHVRMIKEFLKLEDRDKDVFVKYLENVFLTNGE